MTGLPLGCPGGHAGARLRMVRRSQLIRSKFRRGSAGGEAAAGRPAPDLLGETGLRSAASTGGPLAAEKSLDGS
jgi:hypothetical protein